MPTGRSLIAIAQSILQIERNATVLALYRRDNPGYLYLKKYAPHITSQLDEYTLNWTLIPKAVVFSEDSLHELVGVYRSNLEYRLPDLPQGVTEEQYLKMMNRLYDFLEDEVAPYLAKMPISEEVKEDATEELTGYDLNEDSGEDEREGSGEAGNN